jgi:hypothetical protein
MANMATRFFKDGRIYPTEAQLDAAMTDLAEFLSRGIELADASDRMGVSRGTGCVIYKRICDRLGAQAR